ncbi:uncharacterized protein LOC132041969 [Lycium ferocissimum]|uniref:uncharacterized protein LOC132041969 n=1 Tax=Lycium ferocissimum TaxID=112874 RepID=UPI002815F263|nr:uncharacterized protein LOC132041969 [Lycium ferocissimum]
MNFINRKRTVKNSKKEEYDTPQELDLLNKWTIPKIEPRTIYQMGTFEKIGLKQVVKTTEETMTVDNDHATFRLLSDSDLALIGLNKTPIPDKGKQKEVVATPSIQPPPEIHDFKLKSLSDLENLLDEKFKGLKLSPLIAEDDKYLSDIDYKARIASDINKIDEYYAVKPTQRMYYYPRPTPQDVLLEEHEHVISNSYSGKEIYEWNIDGYSERQIYCTIHRMLMYSTICKVHKNTERVIADMIIAGFTGQLKGWWDNYLTNVQRHAILSAVKQEGEDEAPVANIVYTLVINIVEHFSGRWTDNNESIRTMLQNLRCKTLTSFRWYKDVFLCRVMELPESNDSHWKSKFIDGLPPLFAERVRKALRKGERSIDYNNYTYGKLIGTCMQEGLALCNEIQLNQQIKRHGLNERQQLGEFCGQFGMDIPQSSKKPHRHKKKHKDFQQWKEKRLQKRTRRKKAFKERKDFIKSKNPKACYKCGRVGHFYKNCKVKEKIKALNIDDDLRESLYKILLNSDPEPEDDSGKDSDSSSNPSSDEDIRVLDEESYISTSSDDECQPCQIGQPCVKTKEDDEFYKLVSQFSENKFRF